MSDVTKVLAELASAVVGHFDITILLDRIIETTMNTFHAEVCSIFLKNEKDSNSIQCEAGSGFAKNIVNIATYRKGEGFTGMVFATGNE